MPPVLPVLVVPVLVVLAVLLILLVPHTLLVIIVNPPQPSPDVIIVNPPQLLHKTPPRLLLKPPPMQIYGPFVERPEPKVPARRHTSVADEELPPGVEPMKPGELPRGHDPIAGIAVHPSQGGAKHPCLEEISRFLWGVGL